MCNFLSAIVTRTGEVLCNPVLDSHSDLMRLFNVREDNKVGPNAQNFIRVEFTPDDKLDYFNVDGYKFRVDQHVTPSWFDDDMKARVIADLRSRIEAMIIKDERAFLIGGVCMLAPESKVDRAIHCRIVVSGGTINDVSGGTINDVRGGTINVVRGGTIGYVSGGTINDVSGGTINDVRGGTIGNVWGGFDGKITWSHPTAKPPSGWVVNESGLLAPEPVKKSSPASSRSSVRLTKKKAKKSKAR